MSSASPDPMIAAAGATLLVAASSTAALTLVGHEPSVFPYSAVVAGLSLAAGLIGYLLFKRP